MAMSWMPGMPESAAPTPCHRLSLRALLNANVAAASTCSCVWLPVSCNGKVAKVHWCCNGAQARMTVPPPALPH